MSSPYTPVAISGYNASPPEDDGSEVSTNQLSWAKHKTKIGDPLKTALEAINTNVSAAFTSIYGETAQESSESVSPTEYGYLQGNAKRYGATGDGDTDDTTALQTMFDLLTEGVVTANPGLFLPYGDYKISATEEIENSSSQWSLVGESRARSSSLQATAAVAGTPMLSGRNIRDAYIANIEFLGDSGSKPSHGIYIDKDSGSQIGSGGPGKIHHYGLLFRHVEIGFECAKVAGSNNDEFIFEWCTFGQGIDYYGAKFTDTNAAWNALVRCRFDNIGYADVSTNVAIGASRGGNFVSDNCRHVNSELCYEIGSCRSFSITNLATESCVNLLHSTGPYLEADTLSVTGTDTFEDSGGNLPLVSAGDLIRTRGFTNAANNGVFKVTGTPSTSAIEVTTIDGSAPSLTNESAGATAQIASTKLLIATDALSGKLHCFDVSTTGEWSVIWDTDDSEMILSIGGHVQLTNGGGILAKGKSTVILQPGRFQLTKLRAEDSARIICGPGVEFTAGTVTLEGNGQIINAGARGGGFSTQIVTLHDDFLGDVLADQWNSQKGSDAEAVIAAIAAGSVSGLVRIVTGDDAAASMAVNGVQLDSGLNWRASSYGLSIEFRIKLSAITDVAVFVGFTDQVAALEMPIHSAASADTITTNATNAVGVFFDTAMSTDNWWFAGVDGDTDATHQNVGSAPVAATYETFRIVLSVDGDAILYRNDVVIGSTMINAVSASASLTPVVAAFSRGAASRNIDVDFIRVSSYR